ncbi:MAG TPA: hypothetical protein VEB60_00270 [Candidatus Paceibacterota bacterium]|nr:hypothetical protein [Candidatus Paceibacterota bacterium]
MGLKIFTLAALAFSALFLPWWVTFGIVIAGLVAFPFFYLIIPCVMLYDLAYGVASFYPTPFFSTLTVLAAFVIVETVRHAVIFYR